MQDEEGHSKDTKLGDSGPQCPLLKLKRRWVGNSDTHPKTGSNWGMGGVSWNYDSVPDKHPVW